MGKRTGLFGIFLLGFIAVVFITSLMGTGILASLTFGVTAAGGVDSSSTLVKGIVYIGSDEGIYALDATTGVINWVTNIGAVYSSPNVVKGVVSVASVGGIYALNAATGEIIW